MGDFAARECAVTVRSRGYDAVFIVVTCNVCEVSGASAGDSGTWRWELESYVLGAARGEASTGEVAVEVEEEEVNTTTATTTTTTKPSVATAISNHTSATATTHPKILDIIRTLTEATTIAVTATTTTGTTTTAAVQTTSQIYAREGKSLKNIRMMNIKREDEEEKLSSSLFMWNPHRIPIVILTAAVATLILLLPCLACFVFCRPDRRMSYSVEDQEEAEDEDTTRIEKDWNIFVPHTLKWLQNA